MLIEQSMIFALGFLAALLFVLLFLPAFWNRAIRLSIGKISERLPLSLAEVAAERDGVRAESAIVQRRLEQLRERAEQARDAERARVGQLTARMAKLELEIEASRLDASARDLDLVATRRDLLAAEAELGTIRKDQYDTGQLIERAARHADETAREQQRLRDVADERRMTIAALEIRLQDMQASLEDLEARTGATMQMPGLAAGPAADAAARLAALRTEYDRRIEAARRENESLRHELNVARLADVPRPAGDPSHQEDLILLRKSISEVAAEVVRLGGLRDAAAEAPNVLQIRRASARDSLPAGQGKSVGAN